MTMIDETEAAGGRLQWAVHAGGAAVSLALVVGFVAWGVHQSVRDVSGVPVIRALEGDMRAPPDDPGGLRTAHQGLSVNAVQEGAPAGEPPQAVTLAPAPVDLSADDMEAVAAVRVRPPGTEDPTVLPVEDAPAPDVAAPEEGPGDLSGAIAALIAEAEPLGPVLPSAEDGDGPAGPQAEADGPRIIPADVPGVVRSPIPWRRPADLAARVPTVTTSNSSTAASLAAPESGPQTGPALAPAADAELGPEDLAPGTQLVQLGAFDDAEGARGTWAELAQRYPDFFQGRARVVQRAVAGGRVFFRLRAYGFADQSDARRFCAALVAQGVDCIPVALR